MPIIPSTFLKLRRVVARGCGQHGQDTTINHRPSTQLRTLLFITTIFFSSLEIRAEFEGSAVDNRSTLQKASDFISRHVENVRQFARKHADNVRRFASDTAEKVQNHPAVRKITDWVNRTFTRKPTVPQTRSFEMGSGAGADAADDSAHRPPTTSADRMIQLLDNYNYSTNIVKDFVNIAASEHGNILRRMADTDPNKIATLLSAIVQPEDISKVWNTLSREEQASILSNQNTSHEVAAKILNAVSKDSAQHASLQTMLQECLAEIERTDPFNTEKMEVIEKALERIHAAGKASPAGSASASPPAASSASAYDTVFY